MLRHSQPVSSEESPSPSSNPQTVIRVATSRWRAIPVVGPVFGMLIDTKNWLLNTEPVAIAGKTIVRPSLASPSSSSSALTNFENELNELQQKLSGLLEYFNERVLNLSQEMLKKDMTQKSLSETPDATATSGLQAVLHRIADFFKSPDTLLREIEAAIAPELALLEDQIRVKHTAFLNATDLQAKAVLEMDMLMLAREVLDKFIQFVNAVQGEVKTARARKEFEHALLNDLIAFVLKSLANLSLPGIDLEPAYLNDLYEQIADVRTSLDRDFGQALGAIGEVMVVEESGTSAERTKKAQQEIESIIASLNTPTIPAHLRFHQSAQPNAETTMSSDSTRRLSSTR